MCVSTAQIQVFLHEIQMSHLVLGMAQSLDLIKPQTFYPASEREQLTALRHHGHSLSPFSRLLVPTFGVYIESFGSLKMSLRRCGCFLLLVTGSILRSLSSPPPDIARSSDWFWTIYLLPSALRKAHKFENETFSSKRYLYDGDFVICTFQGFKMYHKSLVERNK